MLIASTLNAAPLGTGFTYQGELTDSETAADGTFDMAFELYDDAVGGSSLAPAFGPVPVEVSNGVFSVELDFGLAPFDGTQPWLEITVDGQILSPRQKLTATPYALATLSSNYDRVAIVSPSGGNYVGPLEAMQNLEDWCETPPVSQKCLIYVLPGIYEPGETIELEHNVDLIGSKTDEVIISYNDTGTPGVLNFDNCTSLGCHIENLTVLTVGTSGGTWARGIVSTTDGAIMGNRVHIDISNDPANIQPHRAIDSTGTVVMTHLEVDATVNSGHVVTVENARMSLEDCDIRVSAVQDGVDITAVNASESPLTLHRCTIEANNQQNGSAVGVRVSDSVLNEVASSISVSAHTTSHGFVMMSCVGGPSSFRDTRIYSTSSGSAARAVLANECDFVAHGVDFYAAGISSAAIRLIESGLEVGHSLLRSADDVLDYNPGVVVAPTFDVFVSHSRLDAPGVLWPSVTAFPTTAAFNQLENGSIGTATCTYNVDELGLAIIGCP